MRLSFNLKLLFTLIFAVCLSVTTPFESSAKPHHHAHKPTIHKRLQKPHTAKPLATKASPKRILFIGNSFTFGATSAVKSYAKDSVHDLNNEGIGGVPALFKAFTRQSGLDYDVSLETQGGKGLDFHYQSKSPIISKPWDVVVMQDYSTLDVADFGNPNKLIKYSKLLAVAFRRANPKVALYLNATWSRADLTYQASGHWYGKDISVMAKDVRAGYDLALAGAPEIKAVLPVGEAWTRAMTLGIADANPYDGLSAGQINLWGWDHYHASSYGYYLEALIIFGRVTGLDPRTLGEHETAANDLGISPKQAQALQQVAQETLTQETLTQENSPQERLK